MVYSKLKLWFSVPAVVLLVIPLFMLGKLVVVNGDQPQVPCFFIFGDSLVDNGNNNVRSTVSRANFWPYGIDFPDGPTGRFTNGRNIADILAELLGFDKYIPPFTNATNQDIIGGVNYGSGGAGILDETGRQPYGDIISFNEQLWNHEVTIMRIAKLLGGDENLAKEHLSKCIYYVGMGNNDYLANYLPKFHSATTLHTPEQFAQILITHYSVQLQKLYDYGARKVAVFKLGQLGCVPHELATYGPSNGSSCVEASNKAVQIFNEQLKLLVDELNNRLSDAKFLYIGRNTSNSYDTILIKTYPCCGVTSDGRVGKCLPDTVPCSNRDEYLFWDEVHPTEAANLISAKIAYDNMSPLYEDSIAAW